MPTSAINGVGTQTAQRTTTDHGVGSMKSEDFFRIMVTELQNQDPLQPNKTSDMISEVSQVRSIEQSTKLGDTLDVLVRQQRMSDASGMIGKYVTGESPLGDGSTHMIGGVVTALHYNSDGQATLQLDSGDTLSLNQVQLVTTKEQAEAAAQQAAQGGATAKSMSTAKAMPQAQHPLSEMWHGLGRLLHLSA